MERSSRASINLIRSGKVSPNLSYTFFPTSCSLKIRSTSSIGFPASSPLSITEMLPSTPDISQLSPIPSCTGLIFLNLQISDPPQINDLRMGLNFNGYREHPSFPFRDWLLCGLCSVVFIFFFTINRLNLKSVDIYF